MRILPFVCVMVVVSLINGAIMPKLGYYAPWYLVGSVFALVGSALLYTITANTSNATIYGFTVLIGVGIGLFTIAGFAIGPVVVPPHDANNAIGFLAFAQVVGSTLGLSIAGCLYQNYGVLRVAPILPQLSPADITSVIAGTSNPVFQSLGEAVRIQVVEALIGVMSTSWAVLIAQSAFCVILAPFLRVRSPFKVLSTELTSR